MELTDFWFALIAVLWIGYFFLEGFDFGVGVLLPVIGKSEAERRVMINTIGPVWDGNEVWLLVAGGATFAAFPEWYATLFSGFYLPLLLILVALIIRGVAFEYRGKQDSAQWRARWDLAIFIGSLVPAILWGVAFANIVRGVPIDETFTYTGGFFNLLNPYALLGGVVTLGLFTTHGATFLALKTTGSVRDKAHDLVGRVGVATAVAAVLFLGWTLLDQGETGTWITSALAAASLLAALAFDRMKREGWAFVLTGVTIALAVITLFMTLYPNVMPSSTDPAYSLTVENASSSPYTLKVMTWVAVVMTPIVLCTRRGPSGCSGAASGQRTCHPTQCRCASQSPCDGWLSCHRATLPHVLRLTGQTERPCAPSTLACCGMRGRHAGCSSRSGCSPCCRWRSRSRSRPWWRRRCPAVFVEGASLGDLSPELLLLLAVVVLRAGAHLRTGESLGAGFRAA